MAVSIASTVRGSTLGTNKRVKVCTITLDNSYPTGGYAITAAAVGLSSIDYVLTDVGARNTAGTFAYPVSWDYTNGKLQAFRQTAATNGLAEVANGVDLSTFSARVAFIGT